MRPCLTPSSGSWGPCSSAPLLSPPVNTALRARRRFRSSGQGPAPGFTGVSATGFTELFDSVGLGLLPGWGCCYHHFLKHPFSLPLASLCGPLRLRPLNLPGQSTGPKGPAHPVSDPVFSLLFRWANPADPPRVHQRCRLSPPLTASRPVRFYFQGSHLYTFLFCS